MIDREDAIKIAEKHHGPGFEFYGITHGVPANYSIYGSFLQNPDDVWCVSCSNHPGKHCVVASSRAIVIDKTTGAVLYDGSANDEG